MDRDLTLRYYVSVKRDLLEDFKITNPGSYAVHDNGEDPLALVALDPPVQLNREFLRSIIDQQSE